MIRIIIEAGRLRTSFHLHPSWKWRAAPYCLLQFQRFHLAARLADLGQRAGNCSGALCGAIDLCVEHVSDALKPLSGSLICNFVPIWRSSIIIQQSEILDKVYIKAYE
jgi:hypothetical protein